MKNLLFDVNIIVDICARRKPFLQLSLDSLEKCYADGCCPWIYTGSVQTLEFTLAAELVRLKQLQGQFISRAASLKIARQLLATFTRKMNWLSSLAGEGDVFSADEPEAEQLIRALDRFPVDSIKLLTRDQFLLANHPDKTIAPEHYCRLPTSDFQFNFIDLQTQQLTIRPQLEKNIHTVLHHGRYILGPEVKELENQLAEFAEVKHCIGVSSGTDALLMPLMANNIGPGDAVFTTPFTFIATAEVIQLLGATPVFVDIDPRTFNIDPAKLKLAIQAVKTNDPSIHPLPGFSSQHSALSPKAVIPVDLFGLPADYDPIMALANEHDLFVLADSAQGFGGEYKGRKAGSLAHATTTSFFPAKPLGCYGDGGAIFTNNDDLADKLESIRVHGKGRDKYDNIRTGLNARLHTMQAAILLAKFSKFPRELEAKQKVAEKYTELLSPQTSNLNPPYIPAGMKSAWAQYSILAQSPEQRNIIQTKLKETGIPSMVYYATPLHIQTAFAHLGYQEDDFPLALEISKTIFSLPMHAYLQDKQIDSIVKILNE